jgi:hypothetical protein
MESWSIGASVTDSRSHQGAERPNVLFISVDDLRGDLGNISSCAKKEVLTRLSEMLGKTHPREPVKDGILR